MLEGRRRDRAVITACVFALLSGLTRALLVSLKRALAELARHACEFPKHWSLFSRVLEGRGLVCVEARASVLALSSGSSRALLEPGPMAALRALLALPGVSVGPDNVQVLVSPASSKPWFRKRCPQSLCVCFAQWLNQNLACAVPAPRQKRREPEACFGR